VLEAGDDRLVLRRTAAGQTVICTFNFGGQPMAPAKMGEGEPLLASSSEGTIGPRGFAWILQS
jgi:hypothetical protein